MFHLVNVHCTNSLYVLVKERRKAEVVNLNLIIAFALVTTIKKFVFVVWNDCVCLE